jgi:ABC-type multidrug transport system ATPase subunit
MLPLLYHKLESPERAEEISKGLAERFNFTHALNLRPASTSGGVRKIVTVVRALMLKPELLLMDDPFTGLDPRVAKELVLYLLELRAEGVVRHMYFTTREEAWAQRLGYESLEVKGGILTHAGRSSVKLIDGKAA